MKLLNHLFFALYVMDKPCMGFFRPTHSPPPLAEFDKHSLVSQSSPLSRSRDQSIFSASTSLRGGACSEGTLTLFGKVAASAAVETLLMYKLLSFGVKLNRTTSQMKRILQIAIAVAVVFGSSYFGQIIDIGMSAATRQVMSPNEIPGDADWYLNLKKPSWNPPGWLFPIMWLIVSKPTQLTAVWRLMTNASEKNDCAFPFAIYCAHLSLGDAWNKVFFGLVSTISLSIVTHA